MRIPRFYLPQVLQTKQTLELPSELFRHAIQVLRMKTGESLIIFNGEGGEFHAQLTEVGKRKATADITGFDPANRESNLQLTLVQSIIKPDKMDMAIQKCVELGVTHIQPIISQRSVVRMGRDKLDKKCKHWQAVVISACEQSGRTRIPEILAPAGFTDWLETPLNNDETRMMLMPGDYPRIHSLQDTITESPHISLMIGPEGGFTDDEVELCLKKDIATVSLGPRILRAETAAITVVSLLQNHFGDL
uniref:Ribosomal RNA small subunit methyltransferase E n=1 Tax=uncultured Thiotrichaceae bacterium TaxID=298394 RepID=A0A6S6UB90_9GAMM|nr:MAG: Ribosomal RNA small subunit methyltransferase E (EC [uncultured Thiotrichaceae bacterium]